MLTLLTVVIVYSQPFHHLLLKVHINALGWNSIKLFCQLLIRFLVHIGYAEREIMLQVGKYQQYLMHSMLPYTVLRVLG